MKTRNVTHEPACVCSQTDGHPSTVCLWTRLAALLRLACRPTARLRLQVSSVATGESVGVIRSGALLHERSRDKCRTSWLIVHQVLNILIVTRIIIIFPHTCDDFCLYIPIFLFKDSLESVLKWLFVVNLPLHIFRMIL